MLSHLNYILWNPDVEAFHLFGFSVRWYSLCWLIGLVLAYFIVQRLYKQQKIKDEYFDPLFLYCFFGILLGARLGHCLFYQPEYYLTSWQHFIEMIVPIHFLPGGGWKFVGYEGLASHGGTIGLIVALYLYYRRTRLNLWQVLDNIAIATPITACFIRLGNLMNSEIIGKVTDVPWALSSKGWIRCRAIRVSYTRPSPISCSSSWVFGSIASTRSVWVRVSSSDFASRSSSHSDSLSNIPKTYK